MYFSRGGEDLIVDFWEKAVPLNSRTAFFFHDPIPDCTTLCVLNSY